MAKCVRLPQFELTDGIKTCSEPFLRVAVSYRHDFKFDLLAKLLVLGWVEGGETS